MFDGLRKGLAAALKTLRGKGRLSEANIREAMEAIRIVLLDADVNFTAAENFINRITEKSIGQEVLRSLDPSEQIVKFVYDELVLLMGPVDTAIPFAKDRPTIIMLCGLQGQGKTTTAGKLALTIKGKGRKPLLVAADLQRPAAVEQLRVLGEQIQVPVYSEVAEPGKPVPTPVQVCVNAIAYAKRTLIDTVILDTAGRLHIAEMPMDELKQIDKLAKPDQVYLVCDAMTGQDAVNSAAAFNEALELNGVILTKLDGDARGGAALSIKEVTKVPIKFIGVGEKLDKLEEFRPEGMAQRILGQGDIMSLVEKVSKVQSDISKEELEEQQKKLREGDFNLNDFRKQFEQIAKMGSMKDLIGSMPGMSDMVPAGEDPEAAFRRIKGMLDSMTREERANPDVLDQNRRRRVAAGSGTQPHDVKQFLNQFEQVRNLMRAMSKMSVWERIKMVSGMGKMGAFQPGAKLKTKGDTGHRKTPKERAKERKNNKKR
ncbi:MAG: signal recognition particle protein [Gemmataceae bacterium]